MRRALLVAAGLALALPSPAVAARFGLGVERGFSAERVAERVEARTGRPVTVIGPFAVAVTAPSAKGLASVRGVSYVERLRAQRLLSFTPNDPLAARQWYLERVRAFEAWTRPPVLATVRVAIIDSGIDAEHPELEKSIAQGRSFVSSTWKKDTNGHGTFVAGQIAAELNNAQGIAGMAFPSELLVAKVVRGDDTISPEAEAKAIRWAVDNDARVINLSFGGLRDPFDKNRDAYSPLEAAAIEYAVKNGVLVVAAVGNSDSPSEAPWEFASYPAALPHVLGVSAVNKDGTVPDFSNRDPVFNDIAAPGDGIFSTLPHGLTSQRLACPLQGYSECGPPQFRRGEGTSFSAAQVTAAAALVWAERPLLTPDQVRAILEGSATDAIPARGCRRCTVGRDQYTGWGTLDVASAVNSLAADIPEPDRLEPNDEAGTRAPYIYAPRRRTLHATLDYWNDQIDVYAVHLRRAQRIRVVLRGLGDAETSLLLWKPGTRRVDGLAIDNRRLAARDTSGPEMVVRYRARRAGWYYLQVKLSTPISGGYSLRLVKGAVKRSRAARPQAPRGSS